MPQFKEWALETLDDQNDVETTDINAILGTQNRAMETAHKQMKRLIGMASKEMISEDQLKQRKKN